MFATLIYSGSEAATGGVLWKNVFLEISQNSQKNTSARVSFLIKLYAWSLHLIKKEALAQVFSCEFFEISENTFFTEQLWTTAFSGSKHKVLLKQLKFLVFKSWLSLKTSTLHNSKCDRLGVFEVNQSLKSYQNNLFRSIGRYMWLKS